VLSDNNHQEPITIKKALELTTTAAAAPAVAAATPILHLYTSVNLSGDPMGQNVGRRKMLNDGRRDDSRRRGWCQPWVEREAGCCRRRFGARKG
jgi:hypothetical protein